MIEGSQKFPRKLERPKRNPVAPILAAGIALGAFAGIAEKGEAQPENGAAAAYKQLYGEEISIEKGEGGGEKNLYVFNKKNLIALVPRGSKTASERMKKVTANEIASWRLVHVLRLQSKSAKINGGIPFEISAFAQGVLQSVGAGALDLKDGVARMRDGTLVPLSGTQGTPLEGATSWQVVGLIEQPNPALGVCQFKIDGQICYKITFDATGTKPTIGSLSLEEYNKYGE